MVVVVVVVVVAVVVAVVLVVVTLRSLGLRFVICDFCSVVRGPWPGSLVCGL